MVNRFTISRLLGLVFLISGLLKLPGIDAFADVVAEYGDAYMGVWVIRWRTVIAVAVCVSEVIIGVLAMRRDTAPTAGWLLLTSTISFLYLTAANYLLPPPEGSIESCGCFGEVIHLSPMLSFIKNIILVTLASINVVLQRRVSKLSPLLLLSVVVMAISCGGDGEPLDSDQPSVNGQNLVVQKHFDFGTASQSMADSVPFTFELRNRSPDTVIINNVEVTCPCVRIVGFPTMLLPSGTGLISGKMGIRGSVGKQNKAIFVTYDNQRIILLRVKGIITQ